MYSIKTQKLSFEKTGSTKKTHRIDIETWRSRSFPLITKLLALVLLIAGTFEFIPAWLLRDPSEDAHLWHIAELGALAAILLGGIMLALIRRPQEKPLLAQFFVLSAVILAVGIIPFDIKGIGLLVIAGLFTVTYPRPRALVSLWREGPITKSLLGLSLLLAVFLLPVARRELHWQIVGMGNDIHADDLHWIGSALLIVLLILAGILSATKRPGWKHLSIITGVSYCYLGLIATIVPDYAGSWGTAGGIFTLIAGVFYIMITLVVAESMKIASSEARSASI